jgi:hypothetical protein
MNQQLDLPPPSEGPFPYFTIIPDQCFERAHYSHQDACRSGKAALIRFSNVNLSLRNISIPKPVSGSCGGDDPSRLLYFVELECSDGSTATPAWDKDMNMIGIAFSRANVLHPAAKGAFVVDFDGNVVAEKR